jgi:hypothetical protein
MPEWNGHLKSIGDNARSTHLWIAWRVYPGRTSQIAQTASGQSQDASGQSQPPFSLSWSHYVFLIGLKEEERNFYEIEAAQQGWTLREPQRQFDAGLYERLALSRDKRARRRQQHFGASARPLQATRLGTIC